MAQTSQSEREENSEDELSWFEQARHWTVDTASGDQPAPALAEQATDARREDHVTNTGSCTGRLEFRSKTIHRGTPTKRYSL